MSSAPVTSFLIKKRLFQLFMVFVLCVIVLIGRLAWIQIVQADDLYEKAWQQWNRSVPAQSPRGSIYDREGKLLAGSATVETVVGIPPQIEKPVETAGKLAKVLDKSQEELQELITGDRSAVYLSRKVDAETAREVRELDLEGITFTPEGQRYYPREKLASQVLGFVGIDQGWGGLEVQYEEELQGQEGRMYFPSDARGERIPHEIERFVPPRDGMDLHLTIDETIQYIVERELNRAMVEFEPQQVSALAADPFTGEILAASSKPDFHPEEYEDYDPSCWPLSPVVDSFEPGSTLKLVTLAAAIEEGKFRQDETYNCPGHKEVAGSQISCWTSGRGGHGSIDFLEVVQGSCNPGFITLGQRLGEEKLFSYLEGFGFGNKTGIDYPGEGRGLIFDPQDVGPLELATSSFGQGISVTPLQQVMAVSAMINGGELIKPYLVEKVTDTEGETVKKNETETIRQVVSEETSREIVEITESVVEEGTGTNAFLEGYRIGGKTGTAQKVGPEGTYIPDEYILSFIGYVPVEDPQIVLYVSVDGATRGPQWGSQVSAPLFRRIMEDVINYMEIYPDELVEGEDIRNVETPDLSGLDIEEASALLDEEGLMFQPVGEGERIVEQTPKAGARVPMQTRVIAYLGDEKLPEPQVLVPDLRGYTMEEAREVTGWTGLELEIEGSGIAVTQEPGPGSIAEKGDEVTVTFESPLEREP